MPVETKSWPARDPDATFDYTYTIPLDDGDSVSTYTFEKLDGDGVIDSDSNNGATVTAWLSGGTSGVVDVYQVAWVTAGGRRDDAIITQLVVANEPSFLTGYDKPGPAHFILRYPAFAAVDAASIQFWLTDSERYVDDSWCEDDYAPAIMAHAAWEMAKRGLGAASGSAALPAGVTRFKSGEVDVTISDQIAGAAASGGIAAGMYEAEWRALQRRNFGGPRLVGCA